MLYKLKKRTYDIAAITGRNVKVKWNNLLVPVKDFVDYVDMYIGNKTDNIRVHEKCNERWEYVVALSKTDEFNQISFVNGISTSKGGKHVEYILNQIVKKIVVYIQKKKKMDVRNKIILLFILSSRMNGKWKALKSSSKREKNKFHRLELTKRVLNIPK